MTDGFLDKIYDAPMTADDTRDLYNEWAQSYDAEVGENGYVTPRRCAAALAEVFPDLSAPVLDFGCGTGLSGKAFRAAGFSVVDGMDPAPEMLAEAEAKGIYRTLTLIDPDAALPFEPGTYAAIAAVGVIGAGAAPAETLDLLVRGLAPGGRLVLSLNDHSLADPHYDGRIQTHVQAGTMRLTFQQHGEHLPGIGLKSTVYVLEKL